MNSFGDIWREEIIYSAIARHRRDLGYKSHSSLLMDLFGTINLRATVDFPSHLGEFTSRLSPTHTLTVDKIIDCHTLFPYHTAFLNGERIAEIRELMYGSSGQRIFTILGALWQRNLRRAHMRYCPRCVEQDRQTFGEAYFHRVHQIGVVMVCPEHACRLLDTNVGMYRFHKNDQAFLALEECSLEAEDLSISTQDYANQYLAIAQSAQWLLSNPHESKSYTHFTDHYQRTLADVGLSTYSKKVKNNSELVRAFNDLFPMRLVESIGLPTNSKSKQFWLLKTLRNSGEVSTPICHILVCLFLSLEFKILFEESPPGFFGGGPWPCLNRVCSDYQMPVIDNVDISTCRATRRLRGEFRCHCGFTYRRYGPDYQGARKFNLDYIVDYGEEWGKYLADRWLDPSLSLESLATALGVVPLTVQRHAHKLQLPIDRPGSSKQKDPRKTPRFTPRKPRITDEERYRRRKKYLALRRKYPDFGASEMAKVDPATHAWLMRYDREFVRANQIKLPYNNGSNETLVDWAARDNQCADEIKQIALRLLTSGDRPKRITTSAIVKQIKCTGSVVRHLNRLPKSAALLEQVVESRIQSAVRRINWNKKKMIESGRPIKKWQLERVSGLSRLRHMKEIQDALDTAYKEIEAHFFMPSMVSD
ncbi:MAG: hypothetical protein EPO32_08685 [Anaerolineae bacterium]|nr:MAG: hypothetical protein EPO32_08685 [Anaerolineae bacterium]